MVRPECGAEVSEFQQAFEVLIAKKLVAAHRWILRARAQSRHTHWRGTTLPVSWRGRSRSPLAFPSSSAAAKMK